MHSSENLAGDGVVSGASTRPLAQPPTRDRIIVALDFPRADLALSLAEKIAGSCRWVKVGLELYLAEGNRLVEALHQRGFAVFLDLKLHDIPNTVAAAVRTAASSGADMLTVHASGGPSMLTAAAAAATAPGSPFLLAVTVLTSMDAAELSATGVSSTAAEQSERLAAMAASCGISGFVCSAQEVGQLRAQLGRDAVLVTPGIRMAAESAGFQNVQDRQDDQKRIATPGAAVAAGASYLVVGRPVTRAEDPELALQAMLKEIAAEAL